MIKMKTTLKLIFLLLVFACTAFAGIVGDFHQYDPSAFKGEQRPEQNWLGAQMISMDVNAGTSVWLANYISSWYWPKPVADLNSSTFNMGANKYGYLLKSELHDVDPSSDYRSLIHWANGRSKEITYIQDPINDASLTNTATAYYLDYFDKDDSIYFVMTALSEDSSEVVDSFQYVNDSIYNPDTFLASRVFGTEDIAGNRRINFGLGTDNTRREFIAVYSEGDYDGNTPAPTGQPLPGALASAVLMLGTFAAGKSLKKLKK